MKIPMPQISKNWQSNQARRPKKKVFSKGMDVALYQSSYKKHMQAYEMHPTTTEPRRHKGICYPSMRVNWYVIIIQHVAAWDATNQITG